ncbi:hypothetical protein CLU79DRAFT_848044 [Phycomyces nitens]|nr:hypothetical protein CLU79DRAFT_848044 [Phycomyces nitens]
MLASELPFEVIRNIGSFLRLADLLESSLVCRAWKIPFQESLWDVIELHDEDKMDKMSDVSTRVYAFYRKNGYRTRELVICPNIYIDDKEIFILQQHFPNLDCLVIDHSCLGGPGFGSIGDWSLWGSLTELNVDIGGWHHENPAEAFLNISSALAMGRRDYKKESRAATPRYMETVSSAQCRTQADNLDITARHD